MTREGRWELEVADALDPATAARLSAFRAGFSDMEDDRDRRTIAPEYYLWKLRDNPFGRGYVSLAVAPDGEVVGSSTGTRKKVWFRYRWFDAIELGDAFTHPDWQRRGIYTNLRRATRDRALTDGVHVVYNTPNERSAPVSEKTSSRPKPDLDLGLWVLPLQPARVGARRIRGLKPGRTTELLDRPWKWVLRLVSREARGRAELRPLRFDASFDRLDERIRAAYSFAAARDAKALAYRLVANPESDRYDLLVSEAANGELEAVAVCKDTSQAGMRVLVVADLFGVGRRAIRAVWTRAVRLGLERDYDLLATWAPRNAGTAAGMLPLPAVPIGKKRVFIYANDVGERILGDDGPWLFSMLDTDNV